MTKEKLQSSHPKEITRREFLHLITLTGLAAATQLIPPPKVVDASTNLYSANDRTETETTQQISQLREELQKWSSRKRDKETSEKAKNPERIKAGQEYWVNGFGNPKVYIIKENGKWKQVGKIPKGAKVTAGSQWGYANGSMWRWVLVPPKYHDKTKGHDQVLIPEKNLFDHPAGGRLPEGTKVELKRPLLREYRKHKVISSEVSPHPNKAFLTKPTTFKVRKQRFMLSPVRPNNPGVVVKKEGRSSVVKVRFHLYKLNGGKSEIVKNNFTMKLLIPDSKLKKFEEEA